MRIPAHLVPVVKLIIEQDKVSVEKTQAQMVADLMDKLGDGSNG